MQSACFQPFVYLRTLEQLAVVSQPARVELGFREVYHIAQKHFPFDLIYVNFLEKKNEIDAFLPVLWVIYHIRQGKHTYVEIFSCREDMQHINLELP